MANSPPAVLITRLQSPLAKPSVEPAAAVSVVAPPSEDELPHAAAINANPASAVPPCKNARRESFSRKLSGANMLSCFGFCFEFSVAMSFPLVVVGFDISHVPEPP